MTQRTLEREETLICDVQLDPRRAGSVVILGFEGRTDLTVEDLATDSLWSTIRPVFDYASYYTSRAATFDRRPVLPRDDDSLDELLF